MAKKQGRGQGQFLRFSQKEKVTCSRVQDPVLRPSACRVALLAMRTDASLRTAARPARSIPRSHASLVCSKRPFGGRIGVSEEEAGFCDATRYAKRQNDVKGRNLEI